MNTYRLRYSSVKHSGYKEHPFINIPTKIGLSKKNGLVYVHSYCKVEKLKQRKNMLSMTRLFLKSITLCQYSFAVYVILFLGS